MNSLAETIMQSLKDKSLTSGDAEMMLALDLVKKLEFYRPRAYPPVAISTSAYVDRRLSGGEFDAIEFRRLGELTYTIRKIESLNYSDYKNICEAASLLASKNNLDASARCQNAATRFKVFDREALKKFYEVQAMDAEEKRSQLYR